MNNFLAAKKLQIALEKANILQHDLSFSSNTLQSIKHQNKGPKKIKEENRYPVVDQNKPIRKFKHISGIVVQSILHADRKITNGIEN